jgi:hypothetical membrane protein
MDTYVSERPGIGQTVGAVCAWGGIVGPVVFIADWAILGFIRSGYSPVNDAISELAALGSSTRAAMTAGFIVDGLGLAAYGLALRHADAGPAWRFAVGTGLATLGVAAFPLGTPISGKIHAALAVVAYAALVGVPVAAAATTARRTGRPFSKVALAVSVAAGGALVVSACNVRAHGLAQRTGLTIGDAWVIASAVSLLRRARTTAPEAGSAP